mmetsp:Transcript_22697/g.71393  ORF Transcript_22697/g.71393 Transcript_22697/m.71393 type:complete len:364 (-) Transcript_22697:156-1247(-)
MLRGVVPRPGPALVRLLAAQDAALEAQVLHALVPAALAHVLRVPLHAAAPAVHWGRWLHRLDHRRPHADDCVQGVVVAAALPQVGRLQDVALDVAENVVDAAKVVPAVDVVELGLQRLQRLRPTVSVEVAHEDYGVATLPVLRDELQDVARRFPGTPGAAGVNGQGAVVVHEEQRPIGVEVHQAHPLGTSEAIIECPPLVLRHVSLTLRQQLPGIVTVGHGNPMITHDGRVVGQDATVGEHAPRVLTLLEAHDIVLWLGGARDEVSSDTACPAAPAVEVPPVEVVGQHLDVHGLCFIVGAPDCLVVGAVREARDSLNLRVLAGLAVPAEERHATGCGERQGQGQPAMPWPVGWGLGLAGPPDL